jgi:hypothetical protein
LKNIQIGRLALALVVLCSPLPLAGQSAQSLESPASPRALRRTEEFGLLPDRPRVTPARVDRPPRIDGVLDDEAWQVAAHITEFTQQAPLDGAPATEETDVYVAYDSDNLYFGFHVHYEDPSIMRANRVERDRAMRDDLVTIYLDTFLDQQRGYDFDVNGYGVQGDGVMTAGGRGGRGGGQAIPPADRTWDALFQTGAQIVFDGYVAEMAIPFKSLRYPKPEAGEPHRWGFQIVREIKSKDEENQVWSPMSRNETSFFAQMGLIEGMTDLSTSRNLEIMPTVTAIQYGDIDPTRPAFVNHSADPDAGVNVKYGITSNLTADFTVNPDFSQIESDRQQIEVNQRYPIFFPELRPFFLEGQEIFNVSGPVNFIHTRTIVDPRVGAKLSGKVGKTTLGLLYADDAAPGHVDDVSDPAYGQYAHVFVGRVRYDLYPESSIGILATDREFLNSHSRLGGIDSQFRLGTNYRLNATVMATDRVDTDGVHLSGPLFDVGFRKDGRNFSYSIGHFEIHPDFGTDVGFVRRTDVRQTSLDTGYRWWPEGTITNWGPRFSYSRNYDFDGVLQDEQIGMNTNVQFAQNINVQGGLDRDMERYGGINFWKWRYSFGGNLNTSRRISVNLFFNNGDQIRYIDDPYLGRNRQINMGITLRPLSRLQSNISLNTSRFVDPRDDSEIFNVKVLRLQTTYQFTDRLVLRNITEYNNQDETIAVNLLGTYRVNSGTVFYIGYDDHYQQAGAIEDLAVPLTGYRPTNRAFFTKLQYLFRY